jgi:hypothetical protein
MIMLPPNQMKTLALDEALALIKELVKALQPFVLATSDFDDSWSSADEIDLVFDDSYVSRLKYKAFLESREALAKAKTFMKENG